MRRPTRQAVQFQQPATMTRSIVRLLLAALLCGPAIVCAADDASVQAPIANGPPSRCRACSPRMAARLTATRPRQPVGHSSIFSGTAPAPTPGPVPQPRRRQLRHQRPDVRWEYRFRFAGTAGQQPTGSGPRFDPDGSVIGSDGGVTHLFDTGPPPERLDLSGRRPVVAAVDRHGQSLGQPDSNQPAPRPRSAGLGQRRFRHGARHAAAVDPPAEQPGVAGGGLFRPAKLVGGPHAVCRSGDHHARLFPLHADRQAAGGLRHHVELRRPARACRTSNSTRRTSGSTSAIGGAGARSTVFATCNSTTT